MANTLHNKKTIVQACLALRGASYEFPSGNWGWWIYADSFWDTLRAIGEWLRPLRNSLTKLQGDTVTLSEAVQVF